MKNKIQDEEKTPAEDVIEETCCCIPKSCCNWKCIGWCSLILIVLIGIIVAIVVITGDSGDISEPI